MIDRYLEAGAFTFLGRCVIKLLASTILSQDLGSLWLFIIIFEAFHNLVEISDICETTRERRNSGPVRTDSTFQLTINTEYLWRSWYRLRIAGI